MAASKWPCSFQEEETVGTTHRRTPHDDRRIPMPIGNLKYIHTTCNRCYLQYLQELCKIGIKFILDGSLEWQFGLVLPKHSFLRSLDFFLQYVQMHNLDAVLLAGRGCWGPPPSFFASMPRAKEGCFAHTSPRATLIPSIFMVEIHIWNH